MTVIYYEGERIYFRPIEPEDEPLLRRWVNDPRVWSTLNVRPPTNSVQERKWIENLKADPLDIVFGIVVRDGDRLIGTCGLHQIKPIDRRGLFGIMIGEIEEQNHGYGTEATKLLLRFAFEELNLNRVELGVMANNPRAVRTYEKAGYELEGRFRQAMYRHGKYHDVLRYAILRERWFQLHAQESAATAEVCDG